MARPDEVDLKAYYARISRRFWLLFAGQWLVLNGVSTWAQMTISKAHFQFGSPLYLIPPVAVALAFIRNRVFQAVGLAGFLLLYLATFFGRTLTRARSPRQDPCRTRGNSLVTV